MQRRLRFLPESAAVARSFVGFQREGALGTRRAGSGPTPLPQRRLLQLAYDLELGLSSCSRDCTGDDDTRYSMPPRRFLTLLSVLLFVTACTSDPPPLPDRRYLTGSDWISGGSKSSFVTGGEPIVIENLGQHELRIGSGPDAVFLAPGASHETDGSQTEIYNPAEDRARVLFHVPDTAEPSVDIEVLVKNGSQTHRIRATHRAEARRIPVGTKRVSDDQR